MPQYKILKRTLVAKLDKKKKGIGCFFGIDVFEDVRMGNFSKQVDFLQKCICSYHGWFCRDLFDCKHGIDIGRIALILAVVAEVHFGHGTFAQHIGVVYLIFVDDEETFLAVHGGDLDYLLY